MGLIFLYKLHIKLLTLIKKYANIYTDKKQRRKNYESKRNLCQK